MLVCTLVNSLLVCLIQFCMHLQHLAVCKQGHSNKYSKVPEQLCHCSSSLVSPDKSLLCSCSSNVVYHVGAITRRDRQAGCPHQALEPQVVRGHAEQWVWGSAWNPETSDQHCRVVCHIRAGKACRLLVQWCRCASCKCDLLVISCSVTFWTLCHWQTSYKLFATVYSACQHWQRRDAARISICTCMLTCCKCNLRLGKQRGIFVEPCCSCTCCWSSNYVPVLHLCWACCSLVNSCVSSIVDSFVHKWCLPL